MTIYRDGQAIELTRAELDQAYREAQKKYYGEEVCWQLQEYYNIDANRGDLDWEQIADDVMDAIANDDTHWDCEQDTYRRVIEKYLKERGIK